MIKVKEETKHLSSKKIKRDWYLLDASRYRLGKLATIIATLLIGKHKSSYSPHIDVGDSVVVINARHLKVHKSRKEEKIYYHHTGYVGHLKKKTLKELLKEDPKKIIFIAVKNMLPKNRLQKKRLKRLKIFNDEGKNLKIQFREYESLNK